MPPKRYFDDERAVKPGVISDDLRKALNLHKDKLPIWIYKMRVLGYPPGWLQQAVISSSSLQLFDDTNQPKERVEQDEPVEYNSECFIEFPGFNSPIPEGVEDHCELLGMPPMQPHHQLSYVKTCIPPPKPVPSKRIKLSDQIGETSDTRNTRVYKSYADTDDECQIIDERDGIKLIETQNKQPPLRPRLRRKRKDLEKEEGEASSDSDYEEYTDEGEESEIEVIAITNPSVLSKPIDEPIQIISSQKSAPDIDQNIPNSLEMKDSSKNKSETNKSKELQEVLGDSNVIRIDINPESPESSDQDLPGNNESKNEEAIEEQETDKNGSENQEMLPNDMPHNECSKQNIDSDDVNIRKRTLIAMGCPLPANIDNKKPPLEKFAVGMGELIYFENLPTSTGVFDKMRGIISKVREKLADDQE